MAKQRLLLQTVILADSSDEETMQKRKVNNRYRLLHSIAPECLTAYHWSEK